MPQGSILGPYLCASFLGAIKIDSPYAKLVKYADDMTLIERIDKNKQPPSMLYDILLELNKLKLSVNHKKSKQLLFFRSTNCRKFPYPDIESVESLPILGVTLNSKLNWNEHFDKVCRLASSRL